MLKKTKRTSKKKLNTPQGGFYYQGNITPAKKKSTVAIGRVITILIASFGLKILLQYRYIISFVQKS